MCPTLQETELDYPENVGAIGGYQYGKQSNLESNHFDQGRVKGRSRAICSSAICIYPECTSRTNRVPANYELQQYASAGSSNVPSQTIPNSRGNASVVTLRSGKAFPQPAPHQLLKSIDADSEPNADSQVPQQEKSIPLKSESDEELLRIFRKVEINIPLLDIPKYAKFLKELCVHKRKKMKGSVEVGGIVSMLTKNEDFTTRAQQALPKKCRDPRIFSIPCTIGDCTFADAMLDLGASINVMPASVYKSLNFGDLEPMGMTIQLGNRSIVQPLGVLEDVLVQVNELIFLTDFYVLDMEDETSGKGSTLTWGDHSL
ncbi:hypothetical protein CR513_52152, partial [Mucuna pruriens]